NYSLLITNNGTETAYGVEVQDVIEPGATLPQILLEGGAAPTGTTSLPTGIVRANYLSLDPGSSSTLIVTYLTTGTGTLINTAEVRAENPDPDPTNNAATAAMLLINSPPTEFSNIVISKTDFPDPVGVGSPVTYTITATNTGANDA